VENSEFAAGVGLAAAGAGERKEEGEKDQTGAHRKEGWFPFKMRLPKKLHKWRFLFRI